MEVPGIGSSDFRYQPGTGMQLLHVKNSKIIYRLLP
jgi:hypothetical protein